MSAQTGMPADRRLLDEIVDALIRRHGIVASDLTVPITINKPDGSREIIQTNPGWDGKVQQIALAKAKTLAAETLARVIFAEPNADLYGVHCCTWLGKYESGPYLLHQIAATAMVCRIRAKLGIGSGVTDHALFQTDGTV